MTETKECPYCGREIMAIAKKCKHCGEWLDKNETLEKVPVSQASSAFQHEQVTTHVSQPTNQRTNPINLIFAFNGFIIIVLFICFFDELFVRSYYDEYKIKILIQVVYVIGWVLLSLGIMGLIIGNKPQSQKKEYAIIKTGIIASLIGFLMSLCNITDFFAYTFDSRNIYYILNVILYPMALGFGIASALKLFHKNKKNTNE